MQCSICETEVSERALFCEVCGNRVRRAPVAEPQPARVGSRVANGSPAPRRAAAPVQAAPPVPREEVVAAVRTRAELGERMEPEVLDAFLDRIEQSLITRVDQQIDLRARGMGRLRSREKHGSSVSVPVAICSLIFGIPLTAISADISGLAGLIVSWAGIAVVNVAVNLRRNEPDGRR